MFWMYLITQQDTCQLLTLHMGFISSSVKQPCKVWYCWILVSLSLCFRFYKVCFVSCWDTLLKPVGEFIMLQASLSKFEAKILTSSFKIILLNFLQAVVIVLPSIDYLIGIFLYPLNIFAVGTRKTSCPDWRTIFCYGVGKRPPLYFCDKMHTTIH